MDGDFSDVPAFRKKSNWCPERNRDFALEAYAVALERTILESNLNKRTYRNLTKEEQEALKNLKRYEDIVIKQADKGSAVVVMDKNRYIREAMRQLNDGEVYVSLEGDPTEDMIEIINHGFEVCGQMDR